MPVARQQILNTHQWSKWEAVFSAQSAPMAMHATMDPAAEEQCFLCGPCLNVINRIVSGVQFSSVELSEVE
jgi:hypothetical protein